MKIKMWEKISIKNKLFIITTSLLVGLSLIIFLILYFLLPKYYHQYKINNLEEDILNLSRNSIEYSMYDLEEHMYNMAKEKNLALLLRDYTGRAVYGSNEIIILKHSRYILKDKSDEYKVTIPIYIKDSVFPYTLDIIMPLQPIDEASDVIRTLMPYIIVIAIIISIIGAYIYSIVITRPLIKIIQKEREQELRRKEFIATISHELKTPITIISGQLEGMIYNIGKFKDRDAYLKKTYDATKDLKLLVNEMIDISKDEVLENELNLSKVNISTLINNIIKKQSFLIDDKDIKLNARIEENLFIKADEEKISKVVSNILNNGIKYSPSNEEIYINLYSNKQKIIFRIENKGIMIDEEYLEKIFEPFYRIEKSRNRKTGGSGLGLYIVSKILNSHNIKYSISNGKNSVIFFIEFYPYKQ